MALESALAIPLVTSFALFVAACLYLGELTRRRGVLTSVNEYYLGSRALGKLHFFFTYFATTYSAFIFVRLVGYS
jgi:Na+/proline symporter